MRIKRAHRVVLAVAVLALVGVLRADAGFIDFDSHASTPLVSGLPPASAVVTDDYASLGIVFGSAGLSAGSAVVANPNTFSLPNGACGLDAAGSITANCAADQYFSFVSPSDGTTPATTSFLSFVVGDGGGDLDSWILHIYDISNVELEARVVASISNISESFAYAGINRVWIQNTTGTTAGYLLDNVEFATPTAAVPEPTSLTLMLAGIGFLAKRRRQAR
jgi:hypothetical protein